MSAVEKLAERGSSRLFTLETHDHEALAKAVGLARDTYEVKWWWKYGSPAIDRLGLTIEVEGTELGNTVAQFMRLNGGETQVTAWSWTLLHFGQVST